MIKKFKVKVNSREYEVEVEELKKSSKTKTVEVNTSEKKDNYEVDTKKTNPVPKVKKPEELNKGEGKSDVTAPLPGVIVDILVKEGDKVKENDPVAILEAMKMENMLPSPISGKIDKVYVNKGQEVAGNYPLLTIVG
ncbi:MAG: biotin/lipoyl-binding protein [Victivallales bacterium]|nr:biotin/lipoyl-binding protein [Victivallales bacterium]